ncbi:hypothetical protein G6045_26615 [Streptomyces sp. YC504]|uniref:Uncharacterized protein n=1 Tax=Streptomyces mesophilus TaxID=1775132 RepID=A0A6G4XP40_9ACTN|nr:hypothetical protein [Streptomyces mesophilus]NGO79198.1 hypothetical protein [Streptomyces mesophilus]
MANTRRIDKQIEKARERLEGVHRQDLGSLTAREQRQLLRACARGGTQVVRGRSTRRQDRRIERLWEDAAERIEQEIGELEAERRQMRTEARNDTRSGGRTNTRLGRW